MKLNRNFEKSLKHGWLLFILMVPFASFGQETTWGILGGLGEYSKNVGSKFTFGSNFRHKPTPDFGLGATGTYSSLASASSTGLNASASAELSILHLDADLVYYLDKAGIPDLWMGARLGWGILILTYSVSSYYYYSGSNVDSWSSFEFGPAAGYDAKINENFSVGLDLSYLFASYNDTSLGTLQALGTVKIHF